jgi:hypothetical protein
MNGADKIGRIRRFEGDRIAGRWMDEGDRTGVQGDTINNRG